MTPGFWENFRRKDGTLDLVGALRDRKPVNFNAVRFRKAVEFLLDCEDLQPLTNPDAATIALTCALRLVYGE